MITDVEHIFSSTHWPSVGLLWKNVYSGLMPIFLIVCCCCFFIFYCVLVYSQLTICDSFRGTAKGLSHINTCICSPPNFLPSRLPHNTEQNSMWYMVGRYWLSILTIIVHTCLFQTPQLLPPPSFHPAIISSFSKSVSLFLCCN